MRKGLSREFEDYSRSCMATGCSARHIRDIFLLTTDFLMGPDAAQKLKDEAPEVAWFARQREAMGLGTYVHSFLEVLATTLNPNSTSSLDPNLNSFPLPTYRLQAVKRSFNGALMRQPWTDTVVSISGVFCGKEKA
jgi:hypothetical protein